MKNILVVETLESIESNLIDLVIMGHMGIKD